MAVSQQYEHSSQQYKAYCTEEKLDPFLEASQLLNIRATIQRFTVKPSGKQQVEPLDNAVVAKPSCKPRFCQPQSEKNIQAVRSHAYRRRYKTLSALAQSVCREWTTHRLKQLLSAVSPFAKPLSSATNFTTNPETCLLLLYFALLVLLGFI